MTGSRLDGLSRVAYQTLREYVRAALGQRDLAPGVIMCVQSFCVLAHWYPHLHVLVTDGAFRREGRFVTAPAYDAALLEESWRRAVLAWFVTEGWLEEETATACSRSSRNRAPQG